MPTLCAFRPKCNLGTEEVIWPLRERAKLRRYGGSLEKARADTQVRPYVRRLGEHKVRPYFRRSANWRTWYMKASRRVRVWVCS